MTTLTIIKKNKARSENFKGLSLAEEQKLIQLAQEEGDIAAQNKLIMAYTPLAANMAGQVAKNVGRQHLEDLRQEAYTALVDTLSKYKSDKGSRYGTFAAWHIKSALHRWTMDYLGPTRVGTNLPDKKIYNGFRRLRQTWERRNGVALNDEGRQFIADELKVSMEVVRRMEPRIARSDVSIDAFLFETDEEELPGLQIVDDSAGPEEVAASIIDGKSVRRKLAYALADLDEDAREVIFRRMMKEVTPSFQSIGLDMKKSRKQIRLMEHRALKALRSSLASQGLAQKDILGVF